jgi:hypothetical protein
LQRCCCCHAFWTIGGWIHNNLCWGTGMNQEEHDPSVKKFNTITTYLIFFFFYQYEIILFSICCVWFWWRYINILLLFQMDRFGHFKLWHAGGSILVAISFSSVFGTCVPCKLTGTSSSTLETIGYSTFASIFNVGWAVTQVAHM